MQLSKDQKKVIGRAASNLDRWRTRVIDGHLRDLGCWLPLRAIVEAYVAEIAPITTGADKTCCLPVAKWDS